MSALASINQADATSLARPLLTDQDPRIRTTAAIALAGSASAADVDAAESVLLDLTADSGDANRKARRDVAIAIRHITNTKFRRLLVPLLYDPAPEVADEAMESVKAAGTDDFVFVPSLIALLRNRVLKGRARAVLISYGEPVIDALAFFMRDPDEDIWVGATRDDCPDSVAEVGRRPGRRARGNRRIPPIQDRFGARAAPPRAAEPDVSSRRPIGRSPSRKAGAISPTFSLPQPVPQEDPPPTRCWPTAGAEDGARKDRIYRLLA